MIYPNMSILRSTYLLITPLFWRLPILLFCLVYMLWFNFILDSSFISLFLGGGGVVLLFVMYDNEFKTIKGNKI